MSDEFDVQEYVEGREPEAPEEQAAGFASLPAGTQAELKKLRKEHAANRTALAENESLRREVLTAKYGEGIVELIPPEVTDYARQTELAEMFKDRLASPSTESQVVAPDEAAAEPPTPDEQQLATASGGPATGTSLPASDVSDAQILAIGKTDPQKAGELIAAKLADRSVPEGNPYRRPATG